MDEEGNETDEIVHVLFVCSMNKWRSRTAEKIYDRHPRLNARSAGTSARARRRVSQSDIHWCDLIILMEEKHRERVRTEFRQEVAYCEMHVLGVEDRYQFMDLRLVEELKAAIDPILFRDF